MLGYEDAKPIDVKENDALRSLLGAITLNQ